MPIAQSIRADEARFPAAPRRGSGLDRPILLTEAGASGLKPEPSRRRSHRWLVSVAITSIVIVALAFRLHGAEVNATRNPPRKLFGDEPGYSSIANGLLDGLGFTWPGRVPLYPTWVATVYAFNDRNPYSVPYPQAFLGALSVYLTFRLGRLIAGDGPGLLAALCMALSYAQINETHLLYSEILYAPFLLMAAVMLTRALAEPTVRRFGWAGIWIGLANLVRPTLGAYPMFLLVVIGCFTKSPWRIALKGWGACFVASWVVITPWMIHNVVKWKAVLPLATSHAIVWQGSPEYYHLLVHKRVPFLTIWNEILYDEKNPDWHDPGTVEGDRWWTRRGIESIKAEPAVYAKYFAQKLVYFWVGDPGCDWDNTYPLNWRLLRTWGMKRREIIQIFAIRLLIIPALIGVLILRKSWRKFLPIYSILVFFILLHAATHAEARLSEPLEAFLYIIVCAAFVHLLRTLFGGHPVPATTTKSTDGDTVDVDPAEYVKRFQAQVNPQLS